jgi:hypothetical protein
MVAVRRYDKECSGENVKFAGVGDEN